MEHIFEIQPEYESPQARPTETMTIFAGEAVSIQLHPAITPP